MHHIVFRITCNYLDQGIALWSFPSHIKGLLNATRDLDKHAAISLFRTKRGREIFHDSTLGLADLLKLVVGNREELYSSYLFDMCFAHPGWSGMVANIEQLPSSLLDRKEITLRDFIHLELCFEIDAAFNQFGDNWKTLGNLQVRLNLTLKDQSLPKLILFNAFGKKRLNGLTTTRFYSDCRKRKKNRMNIRPRLFKLYFVSMIGRVPFADMLNYSIRNAKHLACQDSLAWNLFPTARRKVPREGLPCTCYT